MGERLLPEEFCLVTDGLTEFSRLEPRVGVPLLQPFLIDPLTSVAPAMLQELSNEDAVDKTESFSRRSNVLLMKSAFGVTRGSDGVDVSAFFVGV